MRNQLRISVSATRTIRRPPGTGGLFIHDGGGSRGKKKVAARYELRCSPLVTLTDVGLAQNR